MVASDCQRRSLDDDHLVHHNLVVVVVEYIIEQTEDGWKVLIPSTGEIREAMGDDALYAVLKSIAHDHGVKLRQVRK
jgi:hypothetical protein